MSPVFSHFNLEDSAETCWKMLNQNNTGEIYTIEIEKHEKRWSDNLTWAKLTLGLHNIMPRRNTFPSSLTFIKTF